MRASIPVSLAIVVSMVACGPAPAVAPSSNPAPPLSSAPSGLRSREAPVVAVDVPDALRQVFAASDRSADDRALDEPRRSAEVLAFAGVHDGSRVGEVGAWQGYTAELLSRAVGASGHVYAEDPQDFDKWIRKSWDERGKRRELMDRVTHLWRPFEDPFGADVRGLAAVFSVMFYHDTVWLGVDRPKMNAAIFAALAPGGEYVVVDHSARAGDGATVTKKLHRIEEFVVVGEITQAGFTLAARADFLRHPEDTRDWNAGDEAPADKRGKSDRFVLRFVRP
jgi:predicted methyltransferase